MANPNFWNDSNQAKKISQELNQLTEKNKLLHRFKTNMRMP